MKLDTTDQRRALLSDLVDKALKFMDEMNTEDYDEDMDWGGAEVVMNDLSAVEGMIDAEQIFIDTLAKLKSPLLNDRDGQEKFVNTFADGFDNFISNILLDRLYHAVNILNDWGFHTEKGIKFKDDLCEKLAPLVDVYENFDSLIPSGEEPEMKLDTPEERLAFVTNLFDCGAKIDDAFRRNFNRINFGDVLGLIALMEKLTAIQDLIQSEKLLEQILVDMNNIKDVDERTRGKFLLAAGGNIHVFRQTLLMQRIESAIDFADNDFGDRRLVKFQKDFRETLTKLLKFYEDIVVT